MVNITKPISVVLKEARRNKGVSLEEVYKAVKIHPNILHALEEGTTLQLSGVYVKSYIKIYAKYLGISQKELDKYFGPTAVKESEVKKLSPDVLFKVNKEKIQNLLKLSPMLGANLGLKIKNLIKIILVLIAISLFFILIRYAFRLVKRDSHLSAKTQKPKAASVLKAYPKKPEPKKAVKTEAVSNINEGLKLTIFAEEDTWIELRQDGNVVFKGILKKSASETWQAKNKIELQVSNAGAVRLEFNNKSIGHIGRKGQALKSVLFTKDGFTIKK